MTSFDAARIVSLALARGHAVCDHHGDPGNVSDFGRHRHLQRHRAPASDRVRRLPAVRGVLRSVTRRGLVFILLVLVLVLLLLRVSARRHCELRGDAALEEAAAAVRRAAHMRELHHMVGLSELFPPRRRHSPRLRASSFFEQHATHRMTLRALFPRPYHVGLVPEPEPDGRGGGRGAHGGARWRRIRRRNRRLLSASGLRPQQGVRLWWGNPRDA